MISFALDVEDLADTRFAVSPLQETVFSLRVLHSPGLFALHLPWRRSVLGRLGALDTGLLMSLVARRLTLPDFLTPRPAGFAPAFEEELAQVRGTPRTWYAVTCSPPMRRTRSPKRCATRPRRTTRRPYGSGTPSVSCCGATGRSPCGRGGRRYGSWWKPT